MSAGFERRVLIVDDDAGVREAYRKVLAGPQAADDELANARAGLFDDEPAQPAEQGFELEFAEQGAAACETLRAARARGQGFALAFVDMRMPPGWDGMHTIEELWRIDPDLQVVLCTAFSDTSWEDLQRAIGRTDRMLILKKPFDAVEAQQMAEALCTKRELLEAARARERELEAHVSARTQELSEALLVAEAATRAKSEFLAHMSHEIRTPMTAILGFTGLLSDPSLTQAERLEHLDIVRRNGDHLMAILNDILDLSKIDAGQMLVERVPARATAILSEVASLMRVRAAEKRLEFELVYESEVPEQIRTDPTRLRQILLNLVGNAIKFTDHGSVRLRVRTLDAQGAEPVLKIAIDDSGIGIEPAQREQLFQSFQQGDASMTRRFGGTGLGLSISKRLALLLGGDLCVQSMPGQGSTFTVRVPTGPLAGVRMLTRASEALSPAREEPVTGATLACRVLLAEDGRDNQRLIKLILERAGAEVAVAGNGQLACEAARASLDAGRPFDLVLMDMQMPVMDGYTAVRELRQAGWKGPIVALTAHALAGDRERCLAAGCDSYETKPVQRERLLQLCRLLLAPPILPPASDSAPVRAP